MTENAHLLPPAWAYNAPASPSNTFAVNTIYFTFDLCNEYSVRQIFPLNLFHTSDKFSEK